MKVILAGHVYDVENLGDGTQRIQFVQRRDGAARLLPEDQHVDGVLSQELLRVLIDRTLYLNAEAPCVESIEIVGHLRAALTLFETRAARRVIEKMPMVEREGTCPECGHLLCDHQRRR